MSDDTSEKAPSTHGGLYNAIYSASYYLSFGVVFPAVWVARTVPMTDSMRRGFHDGAESAEHSVEDVRRWSAETYAEASRKLGEAVERFQDRVAERGQKPPKAEGGASA